MPLIGLGRGEGGVSLGSVPLGDGESSDFGSASRGEGSRVVCCGVRGYCVLVSLVDFDAICGGYVVEVSPTLVVFCILAGFVRSGFVSDLVDDSAGIMIIRTRMRMTIMVREILWKGVIALGRKAINSKYGYGESRGGSGVCYRRRSGWIYFTIGVLVVILLLNVYRMGRRSRLISPKVYKTTQLICKCQSSQFSIVVLNRLRRRLVIFLLRRRSHENE
jgi:hypothetical protein